MHIQIHNADHPLKVAKKRAIYAWLNTVVTQEGFNTGTIDLILCTDDFLLNINQTHLQHDYFTDIITFDYCLDQTVHGELYLSVERIQDNAERLGLPFHDELHRVMVHGVLHLCGYKDKTAQEAQEMRAKEDYYLTLRTF